MRNQVRILLMIFVLVAAVACSAEPQVVEVTRIVNNDVPVTIEVTRVVTQETTVEVPVEVTRVVEVAVVVTATPESQPEPTAVPPTPPPTTFRIDVTPRLENGRTNGRAYRQAAHQLGYTQLTDCHAGRIYF